MTWNAIIREMNWCTMERISTRKRFYGRDRREQKVTESCARHIPDRIFWSVKTDDVNFWLGPLDLCKHP